MLLQKQTVDINRLDNVHITVADYVSAEARYALIQCAKIAGLENVRLISESRAVATQYAEQNYS